MAGPASRAPRHAAAARQLGLCPRCLEPATFRPRIYESHSREEIGLLVESCRGLREGDPGSHLGFADRWYAATRQYSPALLEAAPLRFPPGSELGLAVEHLRQVNREGRRKIGDDAPLGFLPPRQRALSCVLGMSSSLGVKVPCVT